MLTFILSIVHLCSSDYNLSTESTTFEPTTTRFNQSINVCFQNWDSYASSFNGFWTLNETKGLYSGKGVYEIPGSRYLYYQPDEGFVRWRITPSFPSDSLWCYCTASYSIENIANCNGIWRCYFSAQSEWRYYPDVITYFGACTNYSNKHEYNKQYCGINTWCYHVDMHSINSITASTSITITYEDEIKDTFFDIYITPRDSDCLSPSISLLFEEIDFDESSEYFNVSTDTNEHLAHCTGTVDSNCGHWLSCLRNYPLNVNRIKVNTSYKITLFKTYKLDAKCGNDHPYSLHLKLTMICSSTQSPLIAQSSNVTTSAPTILPTSPVSSVCFENWESYNSSWNGQWIWNVSKGLYFGKAVYQIPGPVYLYYQSYDLQWRIYHTVGTYNRYCYCTLSSDGQSIADCNGIWRCKTGSLYHSHPEFITYSGACTNNPTKYPSKKPSMTPSMSPTIAPTFAPSSAPTRYPTTTKLYDAYFETIYSLKINSADIIHYIAKDINSNVKIITAIIEEAYIDHEDWELDYFEFWVQVVDINGKTISDLALENDLFSLFTYWSGNDGIRLNSFIECEKSVCNRILVRYVQNKFEELVTIFLNQHYNDQIPNDEQNADSNSSDIEFEVLSMDADVKELYPKTIESPQIIFYGLVSITLFIAIIGVFALIYNKKPDIFSKIPGCNVVDDGKWIAIIVFALQFWDFGSDVNLASEIVTRDDVNTDPMILIIAIGAIFFTTVPYISNLVIAVRIKKIVKHNEAAESWFQQFTAVFCLLVVFTGGCFASLALVSSNAFGLKLLSCGLTQFELKRLTKIKIFGTIIIENIPQLILQLLYASHINQFTQAVKLAFFASILSVTATTLSYLIERNNDDLRPVEYYLLMECHRLHQDIDDEEISIDEEINDRVLKLKSYSTHKDIYTQNSTAFEPVSTGSDIFGKHHHLTKDEHDNILNNKGRTQALSEALAELFELQPKNIEIGSTLITKKGTITHVVHMVYKHEIEMMESELLNDGTKTKISPHFYTQQLYQSMKDEINDLFREHFNLSPDFFVDYTDFAGVKKRKMSVSSGNSMEIERSLIMKKMIKHTKTNLFSLQNKFNDDNNIKTLEYELRRFMSNGHQTFDVKREIIMEMLDVINKEELSCDNDNNLGENIYLLNQSQKTDNNDENNGK